MPRTAVTTAVTHDGKDELISGRSVSLLQQRPAFLKFNLSRAHEKYASVTYQEDDGSAETIHLRTIEAQKKHDETRAAEKKQMDDLVNEQKFGKRPEKKGTNPNLKTNGPTVAEFVAAGYDPASYPPAGYATKSTPEEIAAAVTAYQTAENSEAETALASAEGLRKELLLKNHGELLELCKGQISANPNFKLPVKTNKVSLINALIEANYQPK